MVLFYLLLLVWFAYWSAESGASLPWSHKWQDKWSWASELPEAIIAISVGFIAVWGWGQVFDISALWVIGLWIVFIAIAYAGKQSATWAYLAWTNHAPRDPDRKSTLRSFNDFIGKLFGYRLGDEGYSWIWAATKGFIMTLPLGGTGIFFHPIGHEIGSHAKGRLFGDSNMWKELSGGGIGIGTSAILFIYLIGLI